MKVITMTDHLMDNQTFAFILDLYRIKTNAERRQDKYAIESLQQHYPEIFTDEFDEFIENAKACAAYLDNEYDDNFSSMFEVSIQNDDPKIIQ